VFSYFDISCGIWSLSEGGICSQRVTSPVPLKLFNCIFCMVSIEGQSLSERELLPLIRWLFPVSGAISFASLFYR